MTKWPLMHYYSIVLLYIRVIRIALDRGGYALIPGLYDEVAPDALLLSWRWHAWADSLDGTL